MGDEISDEALWSEYIDNLVRTKRNAGKSDAEAHREAWEDVQRIVKGPTGDKIAKEIQDKIDALTVTGLSRERAYYKVATDYLKELQKLPGQRVKEFTDGLRKQREDTRADQSLDNAKKVASKGFWNKSGQTLLKDLWNDFRFDTSEHKDVLTLLRDKFRLAIEETAKASQGEFFKELNNRSFPELMEETKKVFGPNAPPLTPQELFLTDAQKTIDTDVFQRFLAGRDADRALKRLGMKDVRDQNVYEAGKQTLELSPISDSKDDDYGKLDWSRNPKGRVDFKLDKMAKEGLVPDVFGKLELGGNIGVKYTSRYLVLKSKVEAEGRYDLKDMKNWRRVVDFDALETRGLVSGKLKLGAEYKPNAMLRFLFDGNIETYVNRDGAKWSASGVLNLELSLEGDPATRELREKLLQNEKQPRKDEVRRQRAKEDRDLDAISDFMKKEHIGPAIELPPPDKKPK